MSTHAHPPTSAARKLSAAAKQRRHNRQVNKDILRIQASGKPVIPFTSFRRVVHEVLADHGGDYCIRTNAVKALQIASEERLTELFSNARNLALFNGRETVSSRDLQFTLPSKPCPEEVQPEPQPLLLDL